VEFLTHPAAVPLAALDWCRVAACPRQRRHPDGVYCQAHQQRLRAAWRAAKARGLALDQAWWQQTQPAIGVGGQISLGGLGPLVVAQVLVGLQQRCRIDQVKTKEADLRAVCTALRAQQVASIADAVCEPGRSLTFKGLLGGRPDRPCPTGAGHPRTRGRG